MAGNTENHGGGIFSSGEKWGVGVPKNIETALCQRITGTDWKKVLAILSSRKKLPKGADAGCGLETK